MLGVPKRWREGWEGGVGVGEGGGGREGGKDDLRSSMSPQQDGSAKKRSPCRRWTHFLVESCANRRHREHGIATLCLSSLWGDEGLKIDPGVPRFVQHLP